MKKLVTFAVMLVMSGMVFAGAISEQYVRDEYEKEGEFPIRDAWLYKFNTVATKVVEYSNAILGGENDRSLSFYGDTFDRYCIRYKVLLDIGVEKRYITDAVRKQQIEKAEIERRKVSQYLASKSSGLGLE